MTYDPFSETDGTREEILAATYRALREHGYSDLTIKTIGEEFEKSQSLVYHHYDGKDALVLACLEYMLEQFERSVTDDPVEDPRTALERMIEETVTTDLNDERRQFRRTLMELRAQASHDEAYRDHFTRSDRLFQEQMAELVAAGIESGDFQDCDPDDVAATLSTLLSGVYFRQATVDEDRWLDRLHDELSSYLRTHVYADESASETDGSAEDENVTDATD